MACTRYDKPVFYEASVADFASALAIELRRARAPDVRDFLRFKFKNGTSEDFETIHVFGHQEDIPLTEFIYRLEVCTIVESLHGGDLTCLLELPHQQQPRVG